MHISKYWGSENLKIEWISIDKRVDSEDAGLLYSFMILAIRRIFLVANVANESWVAQFFRKESDRRNFLEIKKWSSRIVRDNFWVELVYLELDLLTYSVSKKNLLEWKLKIPRFELPNWQICERCELCTNWYLRNLKRWKEFRTVQRSLSRL